MNQHPMRRAAHYWWRFMRVWIPVSVVTALGSLLTGAAEPIPASHLAWLVPLGFAAIFLGALSYALTEDWRLRHWGYDTSWALAGIVTVVTIYIPVALASGADGREWLTRPILWIFVLVAGGLTAWAYGRFARQLESGNSP
jgi:hypothetical protein